MKNVDDASDVAVQLPDLTIEAALIDSGYQWVAGADEAGRGCLAGPVVAAAVILDANVDLATVRDSKVVPEDERDELASIIKQRAAAWAVAFCSPGEIDSLNILWASMKAMSRAVAELAIRPSYVLADGNHVSPDEMIPWEPVIKGDNRSLSIAAASILAKVERDRIMREHSVTYPDYGWDTNFGYPTQHHYDALARHGATPLHRRSFRLFDTQYDLFTTKPVPPAHED
ncbi:MAG: ribonuclease HII [Rhodothermales bacterium]|nr:ribonuclease HII [Rhodothermales bacterium]